MLARKCSALLACPGAESTQCCVNRVKRKNTQVVLCLLKGRQAQEMDFSLGLLLKETQKREEGGEWGSRVVGMVCVLWAGTPGQP